MSEQTIFERILAGESPADIVHEDDDVLAIRDINPQAPIHVLVIPKTRIGGFEELADRTQDEAGRFIMAVARIARELGLEGKGYRIVFNSGRHGQQTVPYLHAHILGGRQFRWPPG